MNQLDYTQRADARNKEYVKEYEAWLKTRTPAQMAELRALRLDSPSLPSTSVSPVDGPDADTLALAEFKEAIELGPEASTEEIKMMDSLRALLCEFLSTQEPRLTAECAALVTGIRYTGISETEIARKFGVTRAAVSKRCIVLADQLALPPSRAMRNIQACEAYREAQLRIAAEKLALKKSTKGKKGVAA